MTSYAILGLTYYLFWDWKCLFKQMNSHRNSFCVVIWSSERLLKEKTRNVVSSVKHGQVPQKFKTLLLLCLKLLPLKVMTKLRKKARGRYRSCKMIFFLLVLPSPFIYFVSPPLNYWRFLKKRVCDLTEINFRIFWQCIRCLPGSHLSACMDIIFRMKLGSTQNWICYHPDVGYANLTEI